MDHPFSREPVEALIHAGIDDDHALQIGRLALACGAIESNAAWIAQLLISPDLEIGVHRRVLTR